MKKRVFVLIAVCVLLCVQGAPMTAMTGEMTAPQFVEQLINRSIQIDNDTDWKREERLREELETMKLQLEQMGVSNGLTEDSSLFDVDSAPPTGSMIEDAYDIYSYYEYPVVDGTQYTIYNVEYRDKIRYKLAYLEPSIVLDVRGENKIRVSQLFDRVSKFAALTMARVFLRGMPEMAANMLVQSLPERSPDFAELNQVINLTAFVSVNEVAKYVYCYDAEEGKWVHLQTANRVVLVTRTSFIYVEKNILTFSDTEYKTIKMPLQYTKYTPEDLAEYFVEKKEYPGWVDPIFETIVPNVSYDFGLNSVEDCTFQLHTPNNPSQLSW